MRVVGEQARVLITVKATPQPSEKYGDTTCVAGIRLDGDRPSWIRLYPIAFRWLDGASQFHKYDVIDLEVRRRDSDTRAESYSPTEASWTVVDHLPPWKARHEIVSQVTPTSTCELSRAAALSGGAPSLGLVYPTEMWDLEFEPHPKWTSEQLAKMQDRITKESSALIPVNGAIPAILKEPRFKVRYRYKCSESDCRSHVGRILDWELTAFQNRIGGTDQDLKEAIIKKFREQMFGPDRRSGFFMGNFELAARRSKFSVLGVYWPTAKDSMPPALTLF